MRFASFLLILVGCAHSFVSVPDAEWQKVPAAQRATMDREYAAQREQLDREHAAAVNELAAARTSPNTAVPAARAVSPAPGDEWAAAIQKFEQQRRAAMLEVANASAEWQRARLALYESRVALAASKLAVLRCSYEVDRAHAVDRHLLGSDTYDSAPYRAQLAEAQDRWYAADLRVKSARDALTAAAAKLTQTKAAYAALVRTGPQAPTSRPLTADATDTAARPQPQAPAKPTLSARR